MVSLPQRLACHVLPSRVFLLKACRYRQVSMLPRLISNFKFLRHNNDAFLQPVSCLSLRSTAEVVPVHSGCVTWLYDCVWVDWLVQIMESDNDAPVQGVSSQGYEPALICSASDAPPPPAVLRRNIDTSGWKIPAASKLFLSISNSK